MEKLKFYDMKGRKAFTTDKYEIKTKNGRKFAVAKAPSGAVAYRIVSKDFKG
jgi:hypothetical protein